MKLEIAIVAFIAVLVPQTLGQIDPSLLLSLMGSDVRLPPKPPRTIFPEYYRTQQQLHSLQLQQRRQQEMELFYRLKAMSAEELKKFQAKLTPTQLRKLIDRIKYLQQQMDQQKQSPQQGQRLPAAGLEGRRNMVLSGANRIRRPTSSKNSVQTSGRVPLRHPSRGRSAYATVAQRLGAAIRRRHQQLASVTRKPNPMAAIQKYQSYRKKAMSAVGAGCTYPMGLESTLDSFLAFSGGGCATGGAVCYISGQSCVDVGMSIMCCPPGYSSGTLDMLSYMKQMQAFVAQFQ